MTDLYEVLEYTIAELGTQGPKYIVSSEPVQKAINLMREHRIGCCLVIDEHVNLCGIFTERDVLKYIGDKDFLTSSVDKYMTKRPQTIKANESIVIALQMMGNGDFRNLPVVNLENKPVGMISISDIMKFFVNHLK